MSANSNIFSFFCRLYRALALIWACLCVGMTATAQPAQADQTTTYTYQKTLGKSGRPLVTNTLGGYTMQAAHEDWNVVYSKANNQFWLQRNKKAFFSYARWYDYKTNEEIPNLKLERKNNLYKTNGYGTIWYFPAGDSKDNAHDASFNYNGQDILYIA